MYTPEQYQIIYNYLQSLTYEYWEQYMLRDPKINELIDKNILQYFSK